MATTKIEWSEKTFNFVTGCTPISDGCKNCYARRMANRLKGRFGYSKNNPFAITYHPERLLEPESWKKPTMIFVSSMGDLFHKDVHDFVILEIFKHIPRRHIIQLLTKRPERMSEFFKIYKEDIYTDNIWCGTTIENSEVYYRIDYLAQIQVNNRFVSFEPLLDDIAVKHPEIFDLEFMDWVIVGGETGTGARPMKPEWVRNIRDICLKKKIPFFFKKWGNTGSREIDGVEYNQFPINFYGMKAHADFQGLVDKSRKRCV